MSLPSENILILDYGSQYTQLIARRIREAHVYCEIHPYTIPLGELRAKSPRGIILSGGPASTLDEEAPTLEAALLDLGVPILGLCYGMQLLATIAGGKIVPASRQEYGRAEIEVCDPGDLLAGLQADGESGTVVWMSHGDRLEHVPPGYRVAARSRNSPVAAMRHCSKAIFGLQFHPEVAHTPQGMKILGNFLQICGCRGTWSMRSFIEHAVSSIRSHVGEGEVICALSGGVDSSVTAALVKRAVEKRLHCVLVDNGLLRQGEVDSVRRLSGGALGLDLRVVDARERFLARLRGVVDPEEKRRRIGEAFIRVFEGAAREIKGLRYLAQGTLYPDVIESQSVRGPSSTIKTHHNVGGLPKDMQLELIEPLRELFKDEVRELGRELGLPAEVMSRQPFPGPGLAVRIIGEVTPERLEIVRRSDAIVMEEIGKAGLGESIWQSFAVLLPVRTVGVMGDQRTYDNVIAVRAVSSRDGMTADWARISPELLATLSERIVNEVSGVNRVVYDISSKPPSTIEWE